MRCWPDCREKSRPAVCPPASCCSNRSLLSCCGMPPCPSQPLAGEVRSPQGDAYRSHALCAVHAPLRRAGRQHLHPGNCWWRNSACATWWWGMIFASARAEGTSICWRRRAVVFGFRVIQHPEFSGRTPAGQQHPGAQALAAGRMAEWKLMLGRPYAISGRVARRQSWGAP